MLSGRSAPAAADAGPSFDQAVARGVVLVGAFAAITSAARLAQDVAIASRFGTGPLVDAYYFLASLANWPVAVALSLFTLLLVPVEAGERRAASQRDLRLFRSEALGAVLLAALASVPLAWLVLRAIAGGPAGGLAPGTAELAVTGVPAIVGVVPLGIVGALLSAWLVAHGRHVLALLEGLPALVLAATVLLLPAALFWGTAAGFAVQAIAMAAMLHAAHNLPAPALGFRSPLWHGMGRGALLLVAAQVFSAMLPLVDAFFAARLGEGTLATLNFANRLVLGLQGLAALAVQRAALPLLAARASASPDAVHRATVRWMLGMAAAGAAVAALVAVLADPLVSVLFERGRFTGSDRAQVATLLRWGLLQLPPFLAAAPVVAALAASRAAGVLAGAAALGFVVKIAASAWLATMLGAAGLQLATAIMYTATAAGAWLALRHRTRRITGERGPG